MSFRAFLSRDGQRILMTSQAWRHTVPVTELGQWIQFYRKLWGRGAKKPGEPGPYARFHEEPCRALESLRDTIRRTA